jgi:hypothetical protein
VISGSVADVATVDNLVADGTGGVVASSVRTIWESCQMNKHSSIEEESMKVTEVQRRYPRRGWRGSFKHMSSHFIHITT